MELGLVNSTSNLLCVPAPKLNPQFLNPPKRISSNVYNNSLPVIAVKAARGGGSEVETAAVFEEPKLTRYQVSKSYPAPLGATLRDGDVNFAVCSANAATATICLIALSDLSENRVTEDWGCLACFFSKEILKKCYMHTNL